MFIEHSGFLLPRSVSRCRGAGWRYAYPAYGWCIVLAVVDPVALRLPGLRLVHCSGRCRPGGAALTRPTVGALFWPLSTRWRYAYPAYGWCIVLPLSTRWRYAYPAYGWCIVLAVVDPVALRLPGLRCVHRFAFCRPGKRSATGRKGALFKQGVDIILFVVQRRVQFFNLK
ncbi:hypothetical protein AAD048_22065 [Raoultella ornithinolytica]|uniref:hypothetical protein n=1 Tax=Raoultella ornithinolytica TaxID=54291 RepID=UPI0038A00186